MKCPGQDRAYWKGDRAYEIPCPRCGSTVEFFRDEDSRRCHQCGLRFRNPRLALDCASWCDQAEACMGISRSGSVAPRQPEAAFLGRLIEALEVELSEEPVTFARALLVFQHAKELVPGLKGEPASKWMGPRRRRALAGRNRSKVVMARAFVVGGRSRAATDCA